MNVIILDLDDDAISSLSQQVESTISSGQDVQSIDESTQTVTAAVYRPTACHDGPRKVYHYIPNVYYYPPIWKLSCTGLRCNQPECIATRTEIKQTFAIVYRYIGGTWVPRCERVVYENHLDCDCKQCKHIRSHTECVNTTTCPNCPIRKSRSNCYWKPILQAEGESSVSLSSQIPIPLGSCDCCNHTGRCPNPRHVFLPHRCDCECREFVSCQRGFTFDPDCCTCRPLRCPGNQQWDKLLCKCKCPIVHRCPPNYVWDNIQCRCVCNARCPPYSYLDKRACKCLACCPEVTSPRTCQSVYCATQPNELCEYDDKRGGCHCPDCCVDHPKQGINYDCSTLNPFGPDRCNQVRGGNTCQWNC